MLIRFLKSTVVVGVCFAVLLTAMATHSSAWENPKAKKPPRAKPHRRSAGESLPPLPLPATPLRRSERKRQPAPPALVGMINFSEFKLVGGKRVNAFPTTQIDIERLMRHANSRLKIRYRYVGMTLDKFSWDPKEMPLLYVTGWTALPAFSDALLARLRRYLYDGGTLVMHAQCGRPEFVNTAKREIARIFPRRRLAPMEMDSPLFHAYFNISQMRIRRNKDPFISKPPYLECVYLGCRPAIIFSPVDLNCGWDVVKNPIEGGILYHQDDALSLGVNVITTVLANFQYARAYGSEKIYHQQGKQTRDQLVIAQIVHNGDWDPTPHALPNLMKYIQNNTTLNVQFKRETIDLGNVDIYKHPVLYMTGLRKFDLSKVQLTRLRSYLTNGGVLLADAAAGRSAFDLAFRSQLKKVLPNAKLEAIPADSAVFQMPYKVKTVDFTAVVKAQNPSMNTPQLLGIKIDGQWAVVYSPLSLSNGWEQLGFAYNRGYADTDALRMGVNLFAYALTH